jgi:hypothetical protein
MMQELQVLHKIAANGTGISAVAEFVLRQLKFITIDQ